MELDEYLLALRKRWLVIAVLAAVGGALGWAYAQSITPAYRASASVFASVNQAESANELVQGSTFVQNSVTSFGRLASMPAVLDPVIEELGLDTTAKQLGKRVTAENPLNTVILEISTTDTDPDTAAAISNAVARQLAATVQGLSPRTKAGESAIQLSLVAPAVAPAAPFEPNTRFLTASGLAGGAAVGIGLALLLTLLDTRLRTLGDVERVGGLPVLGTIVRSRSSRTASTTVRTEPASPRAEAFRRLQVNLRYLESERRLRTVVVTSAAAGEGKTSTSINLASAVAEKGLRVLLVDADLRRPAVATALGIEGRAGLTTVLIGRARFADVVQVWGDANLHVLTAGEQPPNPSQLLDSVAMNQLLEEVSHRYDLVVIDSPPVLPAVDAALIARHSDGVLLVTRLRSTRRQQLRGALAALQRVGATCLGVVVTNCSDAAGRTTYAPAPSHRSGRRPHLPGRRRAPGRGAEGSAPAARPRATMPSPADHASPPGTATSSAPTSTSPAEPDVAEQGGAVDQAPAESATPATPATDVVADRADTSGQEDATAPEPGAAGHVERSGARGGEATTTRGHTADRRSGRGDARLRERAPGATGDAVRTSGAR